MMNWLEQSKKLLREACCKWGIKASLTTIDNYGSIFTRDAVMSGIIGILLEDDIIIEGFRNTINQLKKLQGAQGQIPSNFRVENGEIIKVSFGTLSPKIDSCTWYLIGVGLLIKEGGIQKEVFKGSVEKVINLLDGIEFNGKNLMYVPKGGNWADEYIYEGYILYDQVLRVWGLSLLANTYGNVLWFEKSKAITDTLLQSYKKENSRYYHSSIYPGGIFNKFDLPAHTILGIVLNKKDSFFDESLDWISENFLDNEKLPPVFYPVIHEKDSEWNTLYNYHLYRFKNKPHHFHNGGIWWIWLGWLGVSLSLRGKKEALGKLVDASFKYLEKNKEQFDFEEYISADDLQPNGTKKLMFTASGIALLCLAKKGFDFSELKPSIGSFIKESLEIKEEYFELTKQVVEQLKKHTQLGKEKIVICVAGESGSGKSVTAKCLQIELEKSNIHSIILHQDGYYKLPPKENHIKRKNDISWVGVNELRLDLMQQHIDQFRAKEKVIDIPTINYKSNKFISNSIILKGKSVLIVEGVYSFFLKGIDYKIFMSRTFKDTLEKRKARSREEYDPFVERVLEIEHSIVSKQKNLANSIISKDYNIEMISQKGKN